MAGMATHREAGSDGVMCKSRGDGVLYHIDTAQGNDCVDMFNQVNQTRPQTYSSMQPNSAQNYIAF